MKLSDIANSYVCTLNAIREAIKKVNDHLVKYPIAYASVQASAISALAAAAALLS